MSKEKYLVTAGTQVFGFDPGREFEMDIAEPQRSQLIESGAIEQLSGSNKGPVVDETLSREDAAELAEYEAEVAVESILENEDAEREEADELAEAEAEAISITEPELPETPEESAAAAEDEDEE
jgi:hypothetical protein